MVIASRKIGYNAILATVPDGERRVMRATCRQLDYLYASFVRKAAIGFIRRERTHAREHDTMNEEMLAHGIPIDRTARDRWIAANIFPDMIPWRRRVAHRDA